MSLALCLAACAPGSGTAGPSASGEASAGFDTTKDVTLTIADGWGTSGTGEVFADVIAQFEAKYPNVTIERDTTDYNSHTSSIALKASSPTPPDVMMLTTTGYGQGFYDFVRADLLLPLDDYSKLYDWPSRVGSDAALDVFRFDTGKGNQWGSGALFGVPEQSNVIGVFYNKSLLAKAGFDAPPTSLAEFESTLSGAKAAGITAIAQSSTYIHTNMALWGSFAADAKEVNDWVYGASGSFSDPANVTAAQKIQDWQGAGYFQDGASGTSDSDAAGLFLNGESMYYISGSWMAGGVDSNLGDDGGVFLLPGSSSSSPVGGGLSTPLVISSKTQHPDVAAAFLDFFLSAETSDFLYTNGWGVPGGLVSSSDLASGPTSASVLDLIDHTQAGPGTFPFLDWAAPQFTTLLPTELQKMAAGQSTPEQYTNLVQSDWESFQQTRKSS
ncbi:ABC transporter substrate-binding protein [Microbacterium lacus]|uniref:ABC transporter substrate-binding protein n=1 Tax=Microbacterium lacus TaxID=415217 RepID=UPI0031D4B744